VPIGPYIADFVCHRAKLVIEVDGAQHGYPREAQADEARTRWLVSQGYQVLRFWNHEVFGQIEVVLDTIHAALYTASPAGVGAGTPTPSPSPQGGGEI
jgi:very-short-patch-repair endonuclease